MSAAEKQDDTRMIVQFTAADLRSLVRDEVQRVMEGKPAVDAPAVTYVSADVLQKHFGISRATVHTWVHDEGCPHEIRGRILRFKMADVEAWFSGRGQVRRVK